MSAKTISWSDEQQAIFGWIRDRIETLTILVVEALAGTGKTTTAIEMIAQSPEKFILLVQFNSRNRREAKAKIKDPRVDVHTFNSIGFRFVTRVWKSVKPDDDVEYDRVNMALNGFGLDREAHTMCARLVAFLKGTYVAPHQDEAYSVAEANDCLTGEYATDEKIVCGALRVLELSKIPDRHGRISFNDQVWLPVAMGWVKPWFDLVIVDERQDMNTVQMTLARRALKDGGRFAMIGDRHQAIYGFRGADSAYADRLKAEVGDLARELPLTVTYRCARRIVAEAQRFVPAYQAAPDAPEGIVGRLSELAMLSKVEPGDVILSRLNAPLMPMALGLLRKNIPARIEGRDIGRQLCGMVKSLKATSVPDFLRKLETWTEKQIERAETVLGKQPGTEERKRNKLAQKVEQIKDLSETLRAVAEVCKGIGEIEQRLLALFQDSEGSTVPAVVLSSVHKAKGLEWPRAYLLSETFRAEKGGEEANIMYVAITRAMRELYYVSSRGNGSQTPQKPICDEQPVSAKPISGAVGEASYVSGHGNVYQPAAPRLNSYHLPGGMTFHKPGNVIVWNGEEHVCIAVNDCNARFVAIHPRVKVIMSRFADSAKTIRVTSDPVALSNSTEPKHVIRRLSSDELKPFLTARTTQGGSDQKTTGQERMTKMSKKTEKTETPKVTPTMTGSAFVNAEAAKGTPKGEASKYYHAIYGWDTDAGRAWFDKAWDKAKASAKEAAKPTPKQKPTPASAPVAAAPTPAAKAPAKRTKKAAAPAVAPTAPPPRATPPPRAAAQPAEVPAAA